MQPRANNLYSVTDHLTALVSKDTPNYVVSASAGGAILLLGGVETLTGCGGYGYGACVAFLGLGLEAMAANQYGFEQTKNFIATNSFALFKSTRSQIDSWRGIKQPQTEAAQEEKLEMKKTM
jgi:hypothetical protein